jgi:hypothetical protein
MMLEAHYILLHASCQYTKGCIFGWKIKVEFSTTLVVQIKKGCTSISLQKKASDKSEIRASNFKFYGSPS